MFASCLLSIFMHNSSKVHFGVWKGVLLYFKWTSNYGIKFENGVGTILLGDWTVNEVDVEMIIQALPVTVLVFDHECSLGHKKERNFILINPGDATRFYHGYLKEKRNKL